MSISQEIAKGIATAALWSDGQPMGPEHDCPWRRTNPAPMGAPFCSVCDEWSETMEQGGLESLTLDGGSMAQLVALADQWLVAIGPDADLYADQRSYDLSQGTVWDYMGHDLYLSAAGHGTGFWDRDLGELGDRLHAATKAAPFNALEWTEFYATDADTASISGLSS